MPRENRINQQMRQRIAQAAARLMAEDGIQDYAQAKRKAARQMGAPDTCSLPKNSEVEEALRAHQALYQKDEQPRQLHRLRVVACTVMNLFARFRPHLTGPVWSGTATRHSTIDLHLFVDNPKEVELFLLNEKIPYRGSSQRLHVGEEWRFIPTYQLESEGTDVELWVFSVPDLRTNLRGPVDGKALERAKLHQVQALLNSLPGAQQDAPVGQR